MTEGADDTLMGADDTLMGGKQAVDNHGVNIRCKYKNDRTMEKLTRREEELMRCFWSHGPLFVRELVDLAPEPKPHFNTISTMVRGLEAKGYVGHKSFGNTYQYYPLVDEQAFSHRTLGSVIDRYFKHSSLGAVSALVEEERLSVADLRELIDRIENQNNG